MEIANEFVLHDLAVLDDALDLGNQEGAHTHCITLLRIPNSRQGRNDGSHFLCE